MEENNYKCEDCGVEISKEDFEQSHGIGDGNGNILWFGVCKECKEHQEMANGQ